MPYDPSVNDRSGEIFAQASANSAAIRAQGTANFTNALNSSFNTAMGMVNKRVEQNNEDNAKMQQSMATGEAMMSLADNYGDQGQKFKTSLAKALEDTKGNPNKMSGAVMAHKWEFDNMQAIDKAEATYAALGNVYAGRASATAAAKAAQPPKMNAETIRRQVSEAKAAGFTDAQIKSKLESQHGDWAVNSVYPSKNQTIWMGQ